MRWMNTNKGVTLGEKREKYDDRVDVVETAVLDRTSHATIHKYNVNNILNTCLGPNSM